MTNKKFLVTTLAAISTFGVAFTAKYEGFTAKPVIPVKGDVPTIGYGTTYYSDSGKSVKMSDPAITKAQGQKYLKLHMTKEGEKFNKTLSGVKLSQTEYDIYMDFTYNFGYSNWKSSSMLSNLKSGKYKAACGSLLKWKYVAKRDCSVRSNGCYGVWTRQVDRHNKCMGENK